MFSILHLIATLMATTSTFELTTNDKWLVAAGIIDESKFIKYLTAFYFAVVTVTTVGYGDILP